MAQPVAVGPEGSGAVVTFWGYLPQPSGWTPDAAGFGRLVRHLHTLGGPPVPLPRVAPLARLHASLGIDAARSRPALTAADHRWLRERGAGLLATWAGLVPPLGVGLVHGDAHLGNLLCDQGRRRAVLGDWDPVAVGPREWDLVLLAGDDRFGLPAAERDAFAAGYGHDVTGWAPWTVLRDLRELHSLAAYIRRAPDSPPAAGELARRLVSLRTGDRTARWHAVG